MDGKRKKVEKWVLQNKNFINYTAFEREISAPNGMIQKFLKHQKPINDEYICPMYEIIYNMTKFSIK